MMKGAPVRSGPKITIAFYTQCKWLLRAAWMARERRITLSVYAKHSPDYLRDAGRCDLGIIGRLAPKTPVDKFS